MVKFEIVLFFAAFSLGACVDTVDDVDSYRSECDSLYEWSHTSSSSTIPVSKLWDTCEGNARNINGTASYGSFHRVGIETALDAWIDQDITIGFRFVDPNQEEPAGSLAQTIVKLTRYQESAQVAKQTDGTGAIFVDKAPAGFGEGDYYQPLETVRDAEIHVVNGAYMFVIDDVSYETGVTVGPPPPYGVASLDLGVYVQGNGGRGIKGLGISGCTGPKCAAGKK